MSYRSLSRLAIGLTALVVATACSSDDTGTGPTTKTVRVRVVNLLPSAASAGLFANGTQVGSNVAFGSASATCFDVPAGRGLTFRNAGSSTDIPTQSSVAFTGEGGPFTVVLYGTSTSPKMIGLSEAGVTAPTTGNNAIRVFNGTGTAGDVWITPPNGTTTGTPSVGNVTPGGDLTTFQSYPTANTQIRLWDTGTTTGTPRVTTTFTSSNLSASRVGTAFLTEANLTGSSTNASVVAAPCS